ncbi:Hypothetical protein CINCED_3A006465 [Cinara cedri]|uniref:Uncharacterized protein n=1 Tax=Cinara cedri TaxID=506608 RepID=A0A5E4MX10_9HEMI|nr:Hypothetical protein CINCED_3A006465 [Cinara cedri]
MDTDILNSVLTLYFKINAMNILFEKSERIIDYEIIPGIFEGVNDIQRVLAYNCQLPNSYNTKHLYGFPIYKLDVNDDLIGVILNTINQIDFNEPIVCYNVNHMLLEEIIINQEDMVSFELSNQLFKFESGGKADNNNEENSAVTLDAPSLSPWVDETNEEISRNQDKCNFCTNMYQYSVSKFNIISNNNPEDTDSDHCRKVGEILYRAVQYLGFLTFENQDGSLKGITYNLVSVELFTKPIYYETVTLVKALDTIYRNSSRNYEFYLGNSIARFENGLISESTFPEHFNTLIAYFNVHCNALYKHICMGLFSGYGDDENIEDLFKIFGVEIYLDNEKLELQSSLSRQNSVESTTSDNNIVSSFPGKPNTPTRKQKKNKENSKLKPIDIAKKHIETYLQFLDTVINSVKMVTDEFNLFNNFYNDIL